MAAFAYVNEAGENRISIYTMDLDSGHLTLKERVSLSGGPGPLTFDPTQRFLYVGIRSTRELASFRVDPQTGALSEIGSISIDSDPCYLFTDRTGRYLLSAYYAAGHAAVHPIGENGAAATPPTVWLATADKAHCVQTDRSNRFAFVPHVMPANTIFQFEFDEATGTLQPNGHASNAQPEPGVGPRHFCFHPSLDVAYFSNEQGCSISAFRFDPESGVMTWMQTESTLPPGFDGANSCAQIHIDPSGRFVYVSNRGHNSIACFAADPSSGRIRPLGQQPTLATPRAFNIDPQGRFLYVGGLDSGEIASYRISESGTLTHLETFHTGKQPMWVEVVDFGS